MRQKTIIRNTLVVFVVVFVLTGCGSVRLASTLKPSDEKDLRLGSARFSIISHSIEYDKNNLGAKNWFDKLDQKLIAGRARAMYPEIFTDDWTALPIIVKTRGECNETSMMISAFLTALTAGVIPFPGTTKLSVAVASDVRDAVGDRLADKEVDFELDQVVWVSLIGPLGAIPVPGEADLPRDGIFLFIPLTKDAYSTTKGPDYLADCIVEAIVQTLRSVDPATLDAASRARKSRLQEVTVDGSRCWSFLAPVFSKGFAKQDKADLFVAMIYKEYPIRGAKPVESITVARRNGDGRWLPVTGYLRSVKNLTAAYALIDNGKPSKVVIKKVAEPHLEDFIELLENSTIDDIRWSNGILVEVKNSTLPRLMREKNPEYLIKLVTRIEKAVLNLNEQAQMADSRVQQMVVEGSGADTTQANELSVLCRQRIAIFKPILSALKQAVATRGR